jgi:hypothetical protein
METTNDLVTFDPVEQVSVQATGMTKPQDSEWKCNMENQMKEMMASLKAIGEVNNLIINLLGHEKMLHLAETGEAERVVRNPPDCDKVRSQLDHDQVRKLDVVSCVIS